MIGCYASEMMVEQCAADKHRLSVIPTHSAIHYVFSGAGYFNGERLTAGDGFLHLKDRLGTYYPDPNDPWCYGWMRVGGEELAPEFLEFAKSQGMVGIKGHRLVGGFRASCYNALPKESVEALVACMQEFARKHGK